MLKYGVPYYKMLRRSTFLLPPQGLRAVPLAGTQDDRRQRANIWVKRRVTRVTSLHTIHSSTCSGEPAMTQSLLPSSVPPYLQIAETLRDRIVRGVWHAGDAIPPLDQFASEFNVARVAARQAVQSLIAEGAPLSHRGHGRAVPLEKKSLAFTMLERMRNV